VTAILASLSHGMVVQPSPLKVPLLPDTRVRVTGKSLAITTSPVLKAGMGCWLLRLRAGQSGTVFHGQGDAEDGPVDGLSPQTGIAHSILVGSPVLQPGEGGLGIGGGDFLPLRGVLEAVVEGIAHRLGQGLPTQLDALSLGGGRHQGGWGAVVL